MPPPRHLDSAAPRDLVAELLALQPYVEHILCDGSREPHVRAAAKDRVQTVLRKAIQHLPTYQPHKEGLRPWLTRITRNERVDAHRSCRRRDDTFGHDHIAADLAPSTCPTPEYEMQVRELLERVWLIIEEMPAETQDVLVLSAFCDDSHAEIAARLGITENAAKMRLSRARQLLAKKVGSIGDHLGVWLLFLVRKFAALRLTTRGLLWQTGYLLPPILIWLVAVPQFEQTLATPNKQIVVAAPDNQQDVDIDVAKRFVPERSVEPATTPLLHAVKPASDKPRHRAQPRRDFDVDLRPSATFMNDRR